MHWKSRSAGHSFLLFLQGEFADDRDRRVGTFHGRPISISESEIDVDWPVDRPEIWPGSPPKNTANQLATLHLCRTLGFIGHEM